MKTAKGCLLTGIGLGLAGIAGQVALMHVNLTQAAPLRSGLTLGIAVIIGALAGLLVKQNALQSAGFTGFVAGTMLTAMGMSIAVRSPNVIGAHPFSSAESALTFISSVLAGTVISSWIVAGIAVLVALPISLAMVGEPSEQS